MKTYITGHLFNKAYTEGWLTTLAYFIYFSANFKHKYFFLDHLTISTSAAYTHIKKLQKLGLITIEDNGLIRLISNKKLLEKFDGRFKLFTEETELDKIKLFLKSVPAISNLHRQKRAEDKKKYFAGLRERKDNGLYLSPNELRKLNKLEESSSKQDGVRLSIAGVGRICKVSKPTAVKLIKYFSTIPGIQRKREREIITYNTDIQTVRALKETYPHLKRGSNYLFVDSCSSFSLDKNCNLSLSSVKKKK